MGQFLLSRALCVHQARDVTLHQLGRCVPELQQRLLREGPDCPVSHTAIHPSHSSIQDDPARATAIPFEGSLGMCAQLPLLRPHFAFGCQVRPMCQAIFQMPSVEFL